MGSAGGITEALKRLCGCIVEFISSHATDPHLYFELQLSREVDAAESIDDLSSLARKLLDWIDALDLPERQMARLDAMLTDANLPPYSVLRSADGQQILAALAGSQ